MWSSSMQWSVYMLAVTVMLGQESLCVKQISLENKHLMIAGEHWYPYFFWECPDYGIDWVEDCPDNRTYDGVMWHLLLFMQQARNFTFTLVHLAEAEWGSCISINNCTGMIGIVNKGEADFALGGIFNCKIILVKLSNKMF